MAAFSATPEFEPTQISRSQRMTAWRTAPATLRVVGQGRLRAVSTGDFGLPKVDLADGLSRQEQYLPPLLRSKVLVWWIYTGSFPVMLSSTPSLRTTLCQSAPATCANKSSGIAASVNS